MDCIQVHADFNSADIFLFVSKFNYIIMWILKSPIRRTFRRKLDEFNNIDNKYIGTVKKIVNYNEQQTEEKKVIAADTTDHELITVPGASQK